MDTVFLVLYTDIIYNTHIAFIPIFWSYTGYIPQTRKDLEEKVKMIWLVVRN